jgi:hypothetical protein
MVGVRLVGAGKGELRAVQRQLGPIEAPLSRDPDILIRFVDRLGLDGPLTVVGARDAGYADGRFVVLRGVGKDPVQMELPFDRIGESLEIRCVRGVSAVPLLIPILNLTVLARGGLPVHASGFVHGGTGVMAAGWARSGKTELLLGLQGTGAQYLGDEWLYLDRAGQRMSGIPEPTRIWDRHLREVPWVRRHVAPAQRFRLAILGLAAWTLAQAGRLPMRGVARPLRRLSGLVDGQRWVQIPPARLFQVEAGPRRARLDRVLLLETHESPELTVEPIPARVVAERMSVSLQEERADFLGHYRRFLFAYPDRRNGFLDGVDRLERDRLTRYLEGCQCHLVRHPHPASPHLLAGAARALLETSPWNLPEEIRRWRRKGGVR